MRAWREGWPVPASPQASLDLTARAFHALWGRGHSTLGGVTLVAVSERVLQETAKVHPHLSAVVVGPEGMRFGALDPVAVGVDPGRLEESLVFLVEQWLCILGALTGEVLSSALGESLLGERDPAAASRTEAEPERSR
ncbi:hypothetical protein A176_000904 [Myxococcus hansupus]|uniref:Uncharacterized protein n=1 Tax=Pseudomyxococcus hansupus TaxID=1297742 RepID=A0A0H4X841_9BACT|nr:hypothetical protein A176_000904 [Myxococcus hansupus]